jgi:shikimate kinase
MEIIHHVRPFVASLSGNGLEGGSIGGQTRAKSRRQRIKVYELKEMSELPIPAGPSTSQEAEILAALGKRLIVLVGMMGAGKSTVGRRLAARLRLPFLDADTEIETAAAMSIPEIFESRGEAYFRDGEARVIARLLEAGPAVLATGGGSFMREETRRRVGEKAVSIWLKADSDIILRRVKRRADRPLLQTPDPAATVDRLIAEREPVYQHADITIGSREVPHDKIVDECIEALHRRMCNGGDTAVAQAS